MLGRARSAPLITRDRCAGLRSTCCANLRSARPRSDRSRGNSSLNGRFVVRGNTRGVSAPGWTARTDQGMMSNQAMPFKASMTNQDPRLVAKHSRQCALGRPWTPFEHAVAGCTCADGPLYYAVVHDGERSHKEVVGRDRTVAEIAVGRVAHAVANHCLQQRPELGFSEWADQWIMSLERKSSTVGSYRSTVAHATRTRLVRAACVDSVRKTSLVSTASCESGAARPQRARVLPRPRRMPAGSCLVPLCRHKPRSGRFLVQPTSARAERSCVL